MKEYLMSDGIWGAINELSNNLMTLSASEMSVMCASTFVTILHALGRNGQI
jgi:hypothetical protein